MLIVNPQIRIADEELQWSYARSGGPGGQNVNKVSSKAVLRWNARNSTALDGDSKALALTKLASRLTKDGELVIASQRFRDQERNRQDCMEKLAETLRQALHRPKTRKKTRPTRGSRERKLAEKRHRSNVKSGRQRPSED